jgi:putative ABC transport system substrate-binding protein
MRRREFMLALGGAAAMPSALWPRAGRAQQPAAAAIGFLHSGSPEQNVKRLAAFHKGLGEAGFVAGKNVAIEYRWAAGRNETLPALAADLIERHVAVIATPGSTPAAIAAKTSSPLAAIPLSLASSGASIAPVGTSPVPPR